MTRHLILHPTNHLRRLARPPTRYGDSYVALPETTYDDNTLCQDTLSCILLTIYDALLTHQQGMVTVM